MEASQHLPLKEMVRKAWTLQSKEVKGQAGWHGDGERRIPRYRGSHTTSRRFILKQLQESIPLTAGSGFRSLLPLGGCGIGQYQEVQKLFGKPIDKRSLNGQWKDGAGMLPLRGLMQEVGLQGSWWEMDRQAYVIPLSWHGRVLFFLYSPSCIIYMFLFLKSLTHPLRLMRGFIRSGQMLRKIIYLYSDRITLLFM